MDFHVLFTRHFARLVWLLVHEPTSIDEQKAALRALVALSKFGPISMGARDWRLEAHGQQIPDSAEGAMELVAQMAAFGIAEIHFAVAPPAAPLLGAARILAGAPPRIDPGRAALERVAALGTDAVSFVLETPRTAKSRSSNGSEPPAPVPDPPAAAEPAAVAAPGLVHEDGDGLWMHFAAVHPSGSADELFARLDRFASADAATRVLDALVLLAENAAREGKPLVVGEVFHGIVQREQSAPDDTRSAYALAIRRMSRPALLRAVAHLLPRKRDRQDDYRAVLVRTGEDGADALIDQLTQAQTADDRRVYFDVLLGLQAGVPTLVHMLGDARWFVARNAADLLGEMRAAQAEEPLKRLLRHQDDRVRRAATNALLSLESPTARGAVDEVLRDPSPSVRLQAAVAIGGRGDGRSAGTLTQALDGEVDSEVQLAIIAALGKVATRDAVQRLIRAAEPEGRAFFRRKPTPLRVAAVQALGEAATPAALAALTRMREDRARPVRDAVARVLEKPNGR